MRNAEKRQLSALAAARLVLEDQLQAIREAGTYKKERVITSRQDVNVKVQGQTADLLNFCANNYLGLSVFYYIMLVSISLEIPPLISTQICSFQSHPEVIQAGKDALDKYGAGLSSVRFICGTQDIHRVSLIHYLKMLFVF